MSSVFSSPLVCYMVADPGKMVRYCTSIAKDYWDNLICPLVERYESTFRKRLNLVCLYESTLGQSIYN